MGVYGLDMPPVIFRRLQYLLVGVGAAPHHGPELGLLHAQHEFEGRQAVPPSGVEHLTEGGAQLFARHGQQPGQSLLQVPAVPHLGQQAEQGEATPGGLARHQAGPHADQGGAREQQAELPRLQGEATLPGQCLARPDPGIEPLRPGDVVILRAGAHRLVFDDLLPFVEDGGDIGIDPVELAALGAVLHQSHPALALLQSLPHIGEGGPGHVGVANQVVRDPFHLGGAVASHVAEVLVGIGDVAGGVRGRNQ
ncbi:hypothetical protein D3C75_623310 [compost metagenome]